MKIINQVIFLLFACLAGCTQSEISKSDVIEVKKTNLDGAQDTEQETLSIIKPDAVCFAEKINAKFQSAGLEIVAQKKIQLTMDQAMEFYKEHREKKFFGELCTYICSGPVIVQILRGKDAIAKNRKIMGNTNPLKAETGTIRREFGKNIQNNAAHGSDSKESATREIKLFFPKS
ncbi:hypothetical protein FACS189472_00160 [Alphaproteobacteria bacterium]|nr:hypothetical protein FACS189472_00160 [Alphaproteobacteria bacterium]